MKTSLELANILEHIHEAQRQLGNLESRVHGIETWERVDALLATANELERVARCLRNDASDEDTERVKRSKLMPPS